MRFTTVIALTLGLAVAGCGKKADQDVAVQDSAGRDLSLAPVDSSARLNDQPQPEAPATPAPPPPSKRPPTKPAPTPPPAAVPSPAPAPAPEPAPARRSTIDAGTVVSLRSSQEFGTKTHKVGQVITASVLEDMKDDLGKTIIPAGSMASLTISELVVSENKDDSGKVVLKATQVTINGETKDLNGVSTSVEHSLKGRGVKAGDAAKVGAGAAAGAVVGKIIGKGKGAVVGGVIGAAAGTAVAVNSADRDVLVPVGARILLKLSSAFET